MSDQLLSIDQAAARLNLHPNTVRAMIDRGELPSVVLGRRRHSHHATRRMVASSALTAFIEAHTEGRTDSGNRTEEG